ncbi:MAG: response regulator transcription factor [Kiritimatiellae bacterium]|nr:response regulator transcription factor [Kiritimatiellia bacterium]
MAEILLVDDDRSLRNSLRAMLEAEGFGVRTARNGDEAVKKFSERRPDVVLLDVMMPGKGGVQACEELRRIAPLAPILFLTAVPSDTTKLRAFGAGADDYIEKTCNPDVLVARIRAALRRANAVSAAAAGASRVRLGKVVVDMALMRVTDGAGLDERLTRCEASIFAVLNMRRGEYVCNDDLFSAVHGEDFAGDPTTIRNHISKLRHKLGKAGDLIVNHPNFGYRLLP